MIRAFSLALGDLFDARVLAVLLRSLLVTLLIFAGLGAVMFWALNGSDPCELAGDFSCPLDAEAGVLGALSLTVLGLWLLFPAVALGVVAAYADRIVAAVEARHYPQALGGARPLGIGGAILLGLRSTARVILYNLVALPFYVVLLVTGVGPFILFILVNGLAFGRDLGEMVAGRNGDRASRGAWLRATRGERAGVGAIAAGLFLIPVANLLAPVLGAAMTTHLFHGRDR